MPHPTLAPTLCAATVTHEPSGVTFAVPAGSSVLDAALDAGVELDHGCRVGACGACAHRVTEGLANLAPPDPIEADSIRRYCLDRDVRLLCRALLRGPVKIGPAD